MVVEASADSGPRQVKRDRDGSGKAGDDDGEYTMVVDPTMGDSSTESVEEVKNEEEADEEEQLRVKASTNDCRGRRG